MTISKRGIVARSRDAERRLAKIVGGKRNPSTGIADVPDVETEESAYELKSLADLPKWMVEAMEQAIRCARSVDKQPVLVLEMRRPGGQNVRFYIRSEETFLADTQHKCNVCEQIKVLSAFRRRRQYIWDCHKCERARWVARRGDMIEWLEQYKSEQGCITCGIDDPRMLDFDYVPERGPRLDTPRRFAQRGQKQKMLDEIAKCDVVCANCHRIRTWKRANESE